MDQLETDYGLAPDMLFMIDFAIDEKEMLIFFKTYTHKSASIKGFNLSKYQLQKMPTLLVISFAEVSN